MSSATATMQLDQQRVVESLEGSFKFVFGHESPETGQPVYRRFLNLRAAETPLKQLADDHRVDELMICCNRQDLPGVQQVLKQHRRTNTANHVTKHGEKRLIEMTLRRA